MFVILHSVASCDDIPFSVSLSCAATCKELFQILSPKITEKYYFRINKFFRFFMYKPQKIRYRLGSLAHNIDFPAETMKYLSLGDSKRNNNNRNIYISEENLPNIEITHLIIDNTWTRQIKKFPSSITHLTYNSSSIISEFPPFLTHLSTGLEYMHPLPVFPVSLLSLSVAKIGNFQSIGPLPPNLTSLNLEYALINQQNVDNLPSSLTQLTLSNSFLGTIDKLPPSLTKIKLGSHFNQPVNLLPPSLKHISFGANFNQPLDNLPCSLISISFTGIAMFNQTLEHLPASLQKLELRGKYNQKIDNLPPSLQNLCISGSFNQSIDHLPLSLQKLRILGSFNQPVDFLPPAITHLSLSNSFSLSRIPSTVTHLCLTSQKFHHPLDELPPSVKYLFINSHNKPIDKLPSSIIQLSIYGRFNDKITNLPPSLTHLIVAESSNLFSPEMAINDIIILPNSLKYLYLNANEYQIPIDNLPPSLTHIQFSSSFNSPVDSLPNSLTHVQFRNNFNQPIDNLPLSLTHLGLSKKFNHPVDKLPNSLLMLIIVGDFDQPIDHLPSSISHLYIHSNFNQKIQHFPLSLKYFVCVGEQFNQKLNNFPPQLRTIQLGVGFNQEILFDKLPPTFHLLHIWNPHYIMTDKFQTKFQFISGAKTSFFDNEKIFAVNLSFCSIWNWEISESLFLEHPF